MMMLRATQVAPSKTFLAALIVAIIGMTTETVWSCDSCGRKCCPMVPVWEEVDREFTVKVPYTEKVERILTVCVPYRQAVERTYVQMVPHQEKRTGVRKVSKCIPERKLCTVKRDFGHWAIKCVEVPRDPCQNTAAGCGNCGSCCKQPCCSAPRIVKRRVWVPDVRTRQVPVTTYRVETKDVPYECMVTVCRAEQRKKTVNVVRYKTEERKVTVPVTRFREETRTCKVRVCKMVCASCADPCDQGA